MLVSLGFIHYVGVKGLEIILKLLVAVSDRLEGYPFFVVVVKFKGIGIYVIFAVLDKGYNLTHGIGIQLFLVGSKGRVQVNYTVTVRILLTAENIATAKAGDG